MEGLLNKAEFILDKSHEILIKGGCGYLLGQPLFHKLAAIYAEEGIKVPKFRSTSITKILLEKLVKRDSLNCLIVNLYRGNEGYSLAVKLGNGTETETVKFPYEDEEFLSYLDNEQLPPMLLDIIDEANIDLFHSGCIIAEVRDYRRSIDTSYDANYILLKPNNQSLAADIANMTRDRDWTPEERLHLESEIIKRTAPPLNLNPSPIIAVIENKIHQNKYKFSGVITRKAAKRYSQVAMNRQKKFEEGPPPKMLKLHGFLSERKDKRPLAKTIPKLKIPMVNEDETSPHPFENKSESEIMNFRQKIFLDVRRLATALDKPADLIDNSLVFVEEYTLETERGQGRIYLTKLTISQRRTDEIYFGELYVDRDYQIGKQNGAICKFQLGTLHQVQRYIKQFKEILTEEGRKTVKITHKVAGQPPRVLHTHGSRDKKETHEQQINKQQHLIQQQQHQEQQIKQGIINSFNLGTNQSIATSGLAATVVSSIAQSTPPNVFLVSSSNGTLKKALTVGSNPASATSTSTLTSLLSQPTVGQVVMGGQSMTLNSLLNRVGTMTSLPTTVTVAGGTVSPQGTKIAINPSIGQIGPKISTLAAQLSRPAPAYSQAVSAAKIFSVNQMKDTGGGVQLQPKPDNCSSTSSGSSNLEALLAGSAGNSKTLSTNATLLERLTAKSVMLNVPKLQENLNAIHKIGGTIGSLSNSHQNITSSAVTASNRIRSEGTGSAPPNINLANIANLPGLNVSLQNLATSLPGIQNLQVSFPGFSMPISITMPSASATNSTILVTSPSPTNLLAKHTATTVVSSSPATVMIASPSGLQQGQVVQLPLGQLTNPQLAAHLTKAGTQVAGGQSTIPVVQVQNMQGSLFTSVRGATTALTTGVNPTVAGVQNISTAGGEITMGMGTLSHSPSASIGSSIVTLTSKQPVPITMVKQPIGKLQWHLQQKQILAKRQQQNH